MDGPRPEGTLFRTALDSAEQTRNRGHRRRNMEKRRFRIAFVLALLFHLSMVTVFEIVIPFPRHDTQYYNVSLVSSPNAIASARIRSGDILALSGADNLEYKLPAVDLPTIEFAEIDRLRIRYSAADPLPDLDAVFNTPRPADSWSRFGSELHRLGRSLRDLALPGEEDMRPASRFNEERCLLHRPAEGFEAYVEWSGPPYDRELLFAPPIKALWKIAPSEITRPLEIVFKVNASGRVINVWSPMIEGSELLDDVQMTLLQYRFAPLDNYAGKEEALTTSTIGREQAGVFLVRPAGDVP